MRVRIAAAMSAAVIGCAGCVGCSGGPAHSRPGTAPSSGTPPTAIVLPTRSVPSPACTTATAASPPLSGVRTAMVGVPGSPFGVAVSPDGQWAFVALISRVGVLRLGPALAPALVRTIDLTAGTAAGQAGLPVTGAVGETLTRCG